jgi:hypothetical protein
MSRTFKLVRDSDVSGVSGTGVICEGVLFSDGHAALHWLGDMPLTTPYPCLEWVLKIHGHEGLTRLVWDDEQGEADFSENDISYLHEVLSDETLMIWHLGARRLLRKIRTAMKLQGSDNPVRV